MASKDKIDVALTHVLRGKNNNIGNRIDPGASRRNFIMDTTQSQALGRTSFSSILFCDLNNSSE